MSAPRKVSRSRASANRPDHSAYLAPFDARRSGRLRRELIRWYAEAARPLPWRGTRDPYAIWISEIMLQQTTVAAVQPYFRRFLEAFPNVAALADADETSVLKLWQGLGYYSRARNLRAAARRVVDEFGGRFPETVDELRSLPGIGRYTAGAIVSFAYDRPAPIVEANTLRLYARLMGFGEDPRSTAGADLLWSFAERILPSEDAGNFNQALMELGSQVCRPAAPDCPICPICPLKTVCRAFEEGRQAEIPLAKKATVFEDVVEHTVVVRRGDEKYLLMRWQPGERWAGLWDFVRFGTDRLGAAVGNTSRGPDGDTLARAVREVAGVTVRAGEPFHELKHGVTRFRIRLVCHSAEHVSGDASAGEREFAWVSARDFADYPLSTSARKVADVVRGREGGLFAREWTGGAKKKKPSGPN
jgi:A/G-specific adenine glycosylase